MNFPVESVAVDRLRPYPAHAKTVTEAAVAGVLASVEEFGWRVPLVVTPDWEIVAGHVRYEAARRMGLAEVPVHVARDLTPEQIRALRLVDNRTAELAKWDDEKLLAELLSLEEAGTDLDDWFAEELAQARAGATKEDAEAIPPAPEVGESEAGRVYFLGRHRLYVGDATAEESYARLCEGATVDLLLTDPPYNVAYEGATSKRLTILNDAMRPEEFRAFLRGALGCAAAALRAGGAFYVFYADRESTNFRGAIEEAGLSIRQQLVWVKNSFVLGRQDYQWRHEPCLYGWKEGAPHYFAGGRRQSTLLRHDLELLTEGELRRELSTMLERNAGTVLEYDKPTRNADHPTAKPLDLIARLVENSCPVAGAEGGGMVLDPFGGSGSTLMACELTGRRCLTMELDARYADVIRRRWAEYRYGAGCDWRAMTNGRGTEHADPDCAGA